MAMVYLLVWFASQQATEPSAYIARFPTEHACELAAAQWDNSGLIIACTLRPAPGPPVETDKW